MKGYRGIERELLTFGPRKLECLRQYKVVVTVVVTVIVVVASSEGRAEWPRKQSKTFVLCTVKAENLTGYGGCKVTSYISPELPCAAPSSCFTIIVHSCGNRIVGW